jgi:hypothetical protein
MLTWRSFMVPKQSRLGLAETGLEMPGLWQMALAER